MALTEHEVLMHIVFPEGAGGRLARVFGVDTRTGQRWNKQEMPMPAEVKAWLEDQQEKIFTIVNPYPDAVLRALVQRMRDAGVHDEAIASYLAEAHVEVLGRTIR
ncbi:MULTISPECIES: hypothetical protein [Methylopilaceae]|uniref:Uncharacterized protein n=2 Tax=Methylopilaceae TaxID=3149309 RepID=A0A4V1KI98_9HYPH|nr:MULTISPECIES: hypothetical protein [Methylocystaceae]QZO00595.1 hypothetical protein K6K41_02395 [Chenggangzhangella methanolivorans]RXF69942.1 hypothetical protein EK403_17570 [Hansschlegelia zhihuaiae]